MSNQFEQPHISSEEKEGSSKRPESTEREEMFGQAEEHLEHFVSDLVERSRERLREDPTFELDGREWKLDDLEEYHDVALLQKQLDILTEQKIDTMEENNDAPPASAQQARTYFELQIIGGLEQMKESELALAVQIIRFKRTHPRMYEMLYGDR